MDKAVDFMNVRSPELDEWKTGLTTLKEKVASLPQVNSSSFSWQALGVAEQIIIGLQHEDANAGLIGKNIDISSQEFPDAIISYELLLSNPRDYAPNVLAKITDALGLNLENISDTHFPSEESINTSSFVGDINLCA